MDENRLTVRATSRGEYGGIWREPDEVFSIANPGERARWMEPADPTDSRWAAPAVMEVPAAAESGASDTARLSRIESKLDWIIDRISAADEATPKPVQETPAS